MLRQDIKTYIKGCNACLASKTVWHKPYNNLQSLPVPIHWWKDLSIDFVTGLPILANWKGNSYKSILVIIDQLMKIVHYISVKITINAPGLAKVIIDIIVCHHKVWN